MVGSAVATIVWLRAAKKTASIRPTNIVRASAGVRVVCTVSCSADSAPAHIAADVSSRARDVSLTLGCLRFTRKPIYVHHRPAGRQFQWAEMRRGYEGTGDRSGMGASVARR